MRLFLFTTLICLSLISCKRDKTTHTTPSDILVFTKTTGFRHESIAAGVSMFQSHQQAWNIQVTETANSEYFTIENLAKYKVIVLLNTTGTLFNDSEKQALQEFVQAGGGILALHAAADAEYSWPWYGQMLGGWFDSHPAIQQAACEIKMPGHPSAKDIGSPWLRTDEWYNFKSLQPDNQVIVTVDETSYTGGTHGNLHPISWYRNFEGGRVFYTAMGHTSESYGESLFIKHVEGAMEWLLQK